MVLDTIARSAHQGDLLFPCFCSPPISLHLDDASETFLAFLCYSERTEEGNTEEGHGSRHGRPIKPAGGTGRCLLRAIGVNVLAPVTSVYLTSYGKSTGRGRHRAGGFRPCLLCL